MLNGFSSDRSHRLYADDGDYRPARGLRTWWEVFCIETVKLWIIGGPIAFNIICQYGTNSATNIFVGHLGNIELSSISIAQSVIGTFSFGFMVDPFFRNFWFTAFCVCVFIWFDLIVVCKLNCCSLEWGVHWRRYVDRHLEQGKFIC